MESVGRRSPSGRKDGPPRGRRLRYALANFPSVQALRFLTKVGLAALVGRGEYGEAAFAGLVAFLFGHVACFGLDEVLISSRRLGRSLYRQLQRQSAWSGALAGLGLCAAGLLPRILDYDRLPLLLAALGPMVFVANLSVLPTAVLVRERDYRAVFRTEAGGIAAMAAVTLLAALAGAGAWSLVLGWYANAATATLIARRLAAPRVAGLADEGAPDPATAGTGSRFMAAGLLGFVAERADTLAVGSLLGRQVIGLYDLAQHVTQVSAQFAAHLAERLFFPLLAEQGRRGESSLAFARLHHHLAIWLVPLHGTAALVLPALCGVLPAAWQGVRGILAALFLAAGARCLDVLCLSAIKARGRSRVLLWLQGGQTLALAVVLALTLGRGVVVVATAIAIVRGASWLASLATVVRLQEATARDTRTLVRSFALLLLWGGAAMAVHAALRGRLGTAPRAVLEAGSLMAVWWAVRGVLDREALRVEIAGLRAKWSARRSP